MKIQSHRHKFNKMEKNKKCSYCGKKNTQFPCKGCDKVCYCSGKCQLSHWDSEHNSVCDGGDMKYTRIDIVHGVHKDELVTSSVKTMTMGVDKDRDTGMYRVIKMSNDGEWIGFSKIFKDREEAINLSDAMCFEEVGSNYGVVTQRQHCFTCKKKRKVFMCSVCNAILYCSKECQKKDWKDHEGMCEKKNFF